MQVTENGGDQRASDVCNTGNLYVSHVSRSFCKLHVQSAALELEPYLVRCELESALHFDALNQQDNIWCTKLSSTKLSAALQ